MRKALALKSSIIGVGSQIIMMILGFICTRVFIYSLGIEIRGISGLLINVLSLLQLSDLGIGTAVTYALYQPLIEENSEEICEIMSLYRKLYYLIGIIILALGILLSFFLDLIIVDTTLPWEYVLFLYFLHLFCTVSTYFVGAYKRNLLYADQKQYILSSIDTIVFIVVTVIRIVSLLVFKSYVVYVILQLIETFVSNIWISCRCNKDYPYLKEKPKKEYRKKKELFSNLKDIIIGRIGGFVYGSTDNLILSKFEGVIQVGLMSNYYQIFNALKLISGGITAPIQPMIGNYIRESKDVKESYSIFLTYSFIRYCLANIIVVSTIVLVNPLIQIWLGVQYQLEMVVTVLMAMDMYISIVHGPTGEFVEVLGLFKNNRNMSLVGMIINLVVSIILVNICGISGVLIGTLVAQLYYWYYRTKIVFSKYFGNGLLRYICNILEYTLIIICETTFLLYLRNIFLKEINIINFILMGMICVFCEMAFIMIFFGRTKEFKEMISVIKSGIRK